MSEDEDTGFKGSLSSRVLPGGNEYHQAPALVIQCT